MAQRDPSPPATNSVSTDRERPNAPAGIATPDELDTKPGDAATTRSS
jgi:hypothetical protein